MANVTPHRTQVQRTHEEEAEALAMSPLGMAMLEAPSPVARKLAVELAWVWYDFTKRLAGVPIVAAMEEGTITREDYLCLLRNLRQQVIDGGRWIAQTAANIGQPLFPIRSALITHAAEEHRDYQMLEANYVAAGGALEDIQNGEKNVGSAALSSYLFHQTSLPDPLHVFGAMFIFEGLGTARAGAWAEQLRSTLDLPEDAVSFLAYHGKNDDAHYDKLRAVLSSPFISEEVARRIAKTARVVARLYILQLEELDHL